MNCLADTTDLSHMRGIIQKTLLVDAIASKAGLSHVKPHGCRVIGGHWHIEVPGKGLIRSVDLLNSYRAQAMRQVA